VRVARSDAACPRCGVFSRRVKEDRTQRARDALSYERPTVLVWPKGRFRPIAGYKAAVRDLAPGAVRVADRFHVQRLAAGALTAVRCRRQCDLTGHRGRKGDPPRAGRRDLLCSRHHLRLRAPRRGVHSGPLGRT